MTVCSKCDQLLKMVSQLDLAFSWVPSTADLIELNSLMIFSLFMCLCLCLYTCVSLWVFASLSACLHVLVDKYLHNVLESLNMSQHINGI